MDDVPARIVYESLGPATTWADVTAALDAAIRHGMRVCVPPQHVVDAADYAPGVDLSTVVGFPHGQHATATKVAEARTAYEAGVAEGTLVPDHGALIGGDEDAYVADVAEVVAAVPIPVTLVVETGLLEAEGRARARELALEADVARLRTGTGFVDGGATAEAVEALVGSLPVTAGGDVDGWSAAASLFEAGADRLSTPAGAAIAEEWADAE